MNPNSTKWLGTGLQELYKEIGPWNYCQEVVAPSKCHHVLYQLPVLPGVTPKPRYNKEIAWDNDHVRMPYSPNNLYPVEGDNGQDILKSRWELIQTALLQPINSSAELENAIRKYNKCPKLSALHYFFEEVLEEDESTHFFDTVLPQIINLALQLPDILPGNIPLLKKGCSKSVSFSQLQASSLLANAFLCTFPWRKESAESYPGINFIRLYTAHLRKKRIHSVSEKLKCIFHYFRRILTKAPTGVITFERKCVSKSEIPRWDTLDTKLSRTRLHITSDGTIEDNGLGMLQVDFANKFVGGGVLGYGCVQEEIRYVICPELILARLFTEALGANEALLVIGAERYSNYSGYGDSFTWAGNHDDQTPCDSSHRRMTSIVAIDATKFVRSSDQYNPSAMLRELNKAYAGFHSRQAVQLSPVATGNWGCGAFGGDAKLKSLIQLMACTAADRDIVYFTFGNTDLMTDVYEMYCYLTGNNVTVCQLWQYMTKFIKANVAADNLYPFIKQVHIDSKNLQNQTRQLHLPSTSWTKATTNKKHKESAFADQQLPGRSTDNYEIESFDSDEEKNDLSQSQQLPKDKKTPKLKVTPEKKSAPKKKVSVTLPTNHDRLVDLFDLMDGNIPSSGKSESAKLECRRCENKSKVEETFEDNTPEASEMGMASVSSESDKDEVDVLDNSETYAMEVDDECEERVVQEIPRKITDYFTKIDKPK